jgi:aryl-alcohol dehydrogenase (NADP+)
MSAPGGGLSRRRNLDKIDQIVPPGIDIAPNGAAYNQPAILKAEQRHRPATERAAA